MIYSQNGTKWCYGPMFYSQPFTWHCTCCYTLYYFTYTHQISIKTKKNFQLTKCQRTWICWIGFHNMCNGKLSLELCVLLQTSAVKSFNVLEQDKYQGTIVCRSELGSTFLYLKQRLRHFIFPFSHLNRLLSVKKIVNSWFRLCVVLVALQYNLS